MVRGDKAKRHKTRPCMLWFCAHNWKHDTITLLLTAILWTVHHTKFVWMLIIYFHTQFTTPSFSTCLFTSDWKLSAGLMQFPFYSTCYQNSQKNLHIFKDLLLYIITGLHTKCTSDVPPYKFKHLPCCYFWQWKLTR